MLNNLKKKKFNIYTCFLLVGVILITLFSCQNEKRLVGVVRRVDIVRAYNHAITRRAHHQHRVETLRLGKLDGMSFVHVDIPAGAPTLGQSISEINLPNECLIVSVRRGRKLHIAHGDTKLQSGDQVIIFAAHDCKPVVLSILTGKLPTGEDSRHRPDDE